MAKGSSFEREICVRLSLWWTKGEKDDVFWRTAGSGGKATARAKRGKTTENHAGDMTFSSEIGKPFISLFNVEMKTGYGTKSKTKEGTTKRNWALLDLLDSKQKEPIFIQLWRQCAHDAALSGRQPLLIFRRNNMGACVALHETTWESLCLRISRERHASLEVYAMEYDIIETLKIVRLADFERFVRPERVIDIVNAPKADPVLFSLRRRVKIND